MDPALLRRLAELRGRIDALAGGRVDAAGLWDRAVARLSGLDGVPALERLWTVARELDRVGVHTAEDARLLRQLGLGRGRAAKLGELLASRAQEVVDELDDAALRAERSLLAERLPKGATSALQRAWPQAARILKVAAIFAAPADADPEVAAPAEDAASRAPPEPPPQSARVAVAQFWAARAKGNLEDVVQRRRDLDAAHELLLRVGSEFDRDRVRRLRMEVTDARQRVRETPLVRSFSELFRHVRKTTHKAPEQAFRSLRSLYERAVEAGEGEVAKAAHAALRGYLGDLQALKRHLEGVDDSQALPVPLAAGVGPTGDGASGPAGGLRGAEDPELAWEDAQLVQVALALGDEGLAQFELAAGCARYFDVEDALGEEVVSVEARTVRPQARRVPYPTARLEFDLASGLHEVRDFVVTDPRLLLHDLAAGRQLVRAYYDEAPPQKPQKIRRTAVRVYVCDASGSMHGQRARFRDAVLLAELNNLRQRALRGQSFDPLYYCFFTDAPQELVRVDSAASATRHIRKLLTESPARGQTDITLALLQAFDSIRAARGKDPYLARATVVLVTDGEDRVALEQLREARAPVGDVEVAMSFIALGEENRDLRSLVREQRASGGRAFYVHLSDAEIGLARTEFDARVRTLLPPDLPVTSVTLERLQPHLDALEALAKGRGVKDAVKGAPPPLAFDVAFPPRPALEEGPAPERRVDGELDRIADILAAIGEAAALAPADVRADESVTLLLHLLGLYELPVPRYVQRLAEADVRHARAVAHLRLLCGAAQELAA